MKQKWKRIGSLILSVCMVFSLLPTMAFAETSDVDSGAPLGVSATITAFGVLSAEIAEQTVETGTAEDELDLPDELTVSVTTGAAVTVTVSGNATVTDSEAEEPEKAEPEEVDTTMDVSGWTSDPAYDGDITGVYTFTPNLALPKGLTVTEGVYAPQITVTVGETAPMVRGGAITGTMNVGGATVSDPTQDANGTGWTWHAASATLTLGSSYPGGYIKFENADATIDLVCNDAVTVNQGSVYAIESSGSLVIKGSGPLTISGGLRASKDIFILGTMGNISGGGNSGIEAGGSVTISGKVGSITSTVNAISAGGDITISDGAVVDKIDAGGTDSDSSYCGIYSQNGSVVINGATGDISGRSYGIYANGGNVFINGTTGAISSAGGSFSDDSAIRASIGVAIRGETGAISSKGDGIYAESDKVLITGKTGDITGATSKGIYANGDITISPDAVVGNIAGTYYGILSDGDITIGGKTGDITGIAGSFPGGGIRAIGGSVTITGETGDITNTHASNHAIEADGDVIIVGSVGKIAVLSSYSGGGCGIYAEGHIYIINSVTVSSDTQSAFSKIPTTLPSSYTATWSDNADGSYASTGSTYTWNASHKYVKITKGGGKLATPTGLTWDTIIPGKAKWTAVDNATTYTVRLYKDDAFKAASPPTTTSSEYDFTSFITETGAYTFTVTAIATAPNTSSDESGKSAVYNYTADPGGPTAPTVSGFRAERTDADKVKFFFTPSTTGKYGYSILKQGLAEPSNIPLFYDILSIGEFNIDSTPVGTTASDILVIYLQIENAEGVKSKIYSVEVPAYTPPEAAATPSITEHPASETYAQNASALDLFVAVNSTDGGTLSYQWYSNTTDSTVGGTLVADSTYNWYTPPTATVGTTYYYCVVTNTNDKATVNQTATATSNIAAITVNALCGTVTGTMDIGGETVSDLRTNAGDISAKGWAWNAATATLTVNSSYTGSPIAVNCQFTDTVNLIYTGDVSITSGTASTIYCEGSLVITGSGGTLTLNSTSSNFYCVIEVYGALTIGDSANVNAAYAGSGTNPEATVIYAVFGVTVSGSANLTADPTGADVSGIHVENGDITISTTGTVTAGGAGTGGALALWNGKKLNMDSGTLALTGNPLAGNRFADLNIAGGNITIDSMPVYRTLLTLSGVNAETRVNTISVPSSGYGISSELTSDDGKLCFLLPAGSQTVTLTAGGNTYTGTVNVTTDNTATATLTKGSTAPTITVKRHPQNVTVTQGQISGTLTTEAVASNGKPVSYQWYRWIGGSASDNTEIMTGETNNTLTIPSNLTAGTYQYSCTYTAEGCEFVESNVTIVTVKEPSGGGDSSSGGGGGDGSSGGEGDYTPADSDYSVDGSNTESWNKVLQGLQNETSGPLHVKMTGTTVIPGTVLEELARKNRTVTFVLEGGISWTIHGDEIDKGEDGDSPIDLKDINMKAKLGDGQIPKKVLEELAEQMGAMTSEEILLLSLFHEGSFGFKARLSVYVGSNMTGRTANIFYYNKNTGKLELMSMAVVDTEGYAAFLFNHASDYAIAMDDGANLQTELDKITLTPAKKTLYVGGNTGKSTALKLSLPNSLSTLAEEDSLYPKITYTSSNSKIATVTAEGKVFAKKAGKATITATVTAGGVSRSLMTNITVKKAYIKLVKYKISLEKGESFIYTVTGYGVSKDKITWVTTEKAIIVIDKKTGKAIAKTTGTDTVVAKYGAVKQTIKVTVK